MGFDVADLLRLYVRICQSEADHPFLCRAIGHRQPAAWPILIDRGAPDHRLNVVAIGLGIGKAL